ncbi:hypothetical protein JYT44_00980 [Caldithrix abyssi]|nr:hypothetical protein [Caldithrix abyssi]
MISTPKDINTIIGQMLIVGLRGTTPKDTESFFHSIDGLTIGGVILYDQNVTTSPPSPHNILSPGQVREFNLALQSFNGIPLFIGVDQEGGEVNRLKKEYGFANTKSWAELGHLNHVQTTRNHSEQMAQMLSDHGFNLNFAPVLDLSLNPNSFIAKRDRCFSGDPPEVAKHAEIFIQAHLRHKVLTVCKHFPGQGSSAGDTHEGFVDVTESWSDRELIPYQNLINNNSVHAIMTSHLFHRGIDPEYPATLSSKILIDLLRDKLGYWGVIMSDDPQMKAISKHYDLKTALKLMILAGIDIFCFGNNLIYDRDIVQKVHSTIQELLNEGSITLERIQQSYHRIMQLKGIIGLV